MTRYVLQVMYDGTQFHGSQVQGVIPTVQLAINTTLSTILRMPITTIGASRTDAGVHAFCNYFQFDLEQELPPDLAYKCNSMLSGGLAVKGLYKAAHPDFSPRYDAIRRRYRYRIYNKKNPFLLHRALFYPFPLNLEILNQLATIIKEYEHFEAFTKRKSQTQTFNSTMHQSYWEQHEEELHYVVEANRFLRGMVRGLVATQIKISRHGTIDDFRNIIESRDCKKAFFDVAGYGLYLEEITYPEGTLTPI